MNAVHTADVEFSSNQLTAAIPESALALTPVGGLSTQVDPSNSLNLMVPSRSL